MSQRETSSLPPPPFGEQNYTTNLDVCIFRQLDGRFMGMDDLLQGAPGIDARHGQGGCIAGERKDAARRSGGVFLAGQNEVNPPSLIQTNEEGEKRAL